MKHIIHWDMVAIGVVGILICAVIRKLTWEAGTNFLRPVEMWLKKQEQSHPYRLLFCRFAFTICFMIGVVFVLTWSVRTGILK